MEFTHEREVSCHGFTKINVVYTNMAASVDAWIDKVEVKLAAAKTKIVGVDVEYTRKGFYRQKAATLQMCVDEECLVYHACNADKTSDKLSSFMKNRNYIFVGVDIEQDINMLGRSNMYITRTAFKDIQEIWRDPDSEKSMDQKQGLKDLASAVIDRYYETMKDGFGEKEHSMWAEAPLPPKHLEYAARDAYAAYEIYSRLDLYQRGFSSIEKNSKNKRARGW